MIEKEAFKRAESSHTEEANLELSCFRCRLYQVLVDNSVGLNTIVFLELVKVGASFSQLGHLGEVSSYPLWLGRLLG